MSMTKAEFFDILREYASKEFEDIPQSDAKIAHEFSQEFEDKMDKVLEIVVLGRAARNGSSLKNRQPLGTMYVKLDGTLFSS